MQKTGKGKDPGVATSIISSFECEQRLRDQPEKSQFFQFMIPSLDDALDGFELGELIVLSGPTKNGKSLLFQTLTAGFLKSEIYSLWFSYEMPARQLLARFPVPLPFFYLPEKLDGRVLAWLEMYIQQAKDKYGCKIAFIDHLHFLVDMARSKNASLEIGTVIRGLKQIAIRQDIVIFLAAHMTKMPLDKTPSYNDLRDSSFIAQESDVVLMLWRLREGQEYTNRATLKIEFSRRTGIFEKYIRVAKQDGYLRELTDDRGREAQKGNNRTSTVVDLRSARHNRV